MFFWLDRPRRNFLGKELIGEPLETSASEASLFLGVHEAVVKAGSMLCRTKLCKFWGRVFEQLRPQGHLVFAISEKEKTLKTRLIFDRPIVQFDMTTTRRLTHNLKIYHGFDAKNLCNTVDSSQKYEYRHRCEFCKGL